LLLVNVVIDINCNLTERSFL